MKVSRILLASSLVVGLSGCFATGSASQAETAAPVVTKPAKIQSVSAGAFNLYVGSTKAGTLTITTKQGKKTQKTTVKQDVEVKANGVTYYTTGPVVQGQDVRTAFVAKTVSGDPALGLRLSDDANKRLGAALEANKTGTVLASFNKSVFSQVNNAGAKLEDGVLLLPMHSLNEARSVADLLRRK